MSSPVVTFTAEEQSRLQELTNASNQFAAYKQLLLRGTYSGTDSRLVVEAVGFFDSIGQQTEDQLQELRNQAAARSSQPAAQEVPAPSKKKGSK